MKRDKKNTSNRNKRKSYQIFEIYKINMLSLQDKEIFAKEGNANYLKASGYALTDEFYHAVFFW